jgi:hypothetical protein
MKICRTRELRKLPDDRRCGRVGSLSRSPVERALPRVLLAAAFLIIAATAVAQVPWANRQGGPGVSDIPPGGGFMFCRLQYTSVRSDRSGTGWSIEYPRADFNFMVRLSQFTTSPIRRYDNGEPAHALVVATDPDLFKCPFLKMSSPGTVGFS